MKILVSAAGPLRGQVGGGQTYVRHEVAELARRGHDVVLVSERPFVEGDPPDPRREEALEGLPAWTIGTAGPEGEGGDWTQRNASPLAALRKLLDHIAPDFVHINGMKSLLVHVANEAGLAHAVTAHHPGVVCPAGTMLRPNERICPRPAGPQVCISCFCRQRRFGSTLGALLGIAPTRLLTVSRNAARRLRASKFVITGLSYPEGVLRHLEDRRVALDNAQCWIAPSTAAKRLLELNGVIPSRIQLVPHGIQPLRRGEPCRVDRPLRFGYLGQINRAKGVHILMRAFAQLPHELASELHVYGAPQRPGEAEYFNSHVAPHRSETVSLHGRIDPSEVQSAMESVDVLVVPSIILEIFGLVVLEALSAGRPVIATRCGGPEDTIRDGVDGLLVRPNDHKSLAAAMTRLAVNRREVRQMAEAIQPVRTIGEHVDHLTRVFRGLMESPGADGSGAQTRA